MKHFEQIPPGYAYDVAVVQEQVDAALARDLPSLSLESNPDLAGEKILIIGGGPTLKDDVGGGCTRLQELDKRSGALKVLAGSSHRLLDEGGLKNCAHVCVMNTPGQTMEKVVGRDHRGLEYWLASLSHPDLFKKLTSLDVNAEYISVWHAHVPGVWYPEDATVVGPGSTSATAAVALLILQGYKDFEFYGVDGGNFEVLPNTYLAYDHRDFTEDPKRKADFAEHIVVEIGGKPMKVPTNFWRQAEEMMKIIEASPNCSFRFHGDSLNNLLFNQGLQARVIYDATLAARLAQQSEGPTPEGPK